MIAGILGGECAAALAGGINIMLWHDVTAGICALQVMCRTECLIPPDIPSALSARRAYMRLAQALSPEGRCKSFDASGNGYGRGEGVNALVLRNCASEGRRPATTVLAVVQGSAVNQDGRSSSLTAPNGPAQQVHELHELQTFVAGWLRTMLLTRLPRTALAGTAGDGTNIRRARCLRRCPIWQHTAQARHWAIQSRLALWQPL